LDRVIVPKGLRDASDSVGLMSRGSELPMGEEATTVRLFLWWKGDVDVDLSAVGLTAAFDQESTCNFHELRPRGLTHSGDIVSAPEGSAEAIDINFKELPPNVRYVALTANVYSGPNFCDMEECFVGWQERTSPAQRGNIMELKTVVEKFQISCATKALLPVVFDVKERRLMWLDLPLRSRVGSSIHGAMGAIQDAVEDFQLYAARHQKLDRLVNLHILARGGVLVEKASQADTVFSLTPVVAKKDQTVIAACQPRVIASSLLPSPAPRGSAQAPDQVEVQANALNPAATPARAPRVRR